MAINVRPLRNISPTTDREEIHLIVEDEEDLGSAWLGCIEPEEVPTTAEEFFKTIDNHSFYVENTLDNMFCFVTNEHSGGREPTSFLLLDFDGNPVCEISAQEVHDFWMKKGVA